MLRVCLCAALLNTNPADQYLTMLTHTSLPHPQHARELACSRHFMTEGLSPEYVTFHEGRGMRSSVHVYLMRPEAVEAFFVLWRLTGNTKYREYGWGVFQAIEKWCKVGAQSWLVCLSVYSVTCPGGCFRCEMQRYSLGLLCHSLLIKIELGLCAVWHGHWHVKPEKLVQTVHIKLHE
jgi:hypothetical protein